MMQSHDDEQRIEPLRRHALGHAPELPVSRQLALRAMARELTPEGPLGALGDAIGGADADAAMEDVQDPSLPLVARDHRQHPGLPVGAETPTGPLSAMVEALDRMDVEPAPARPSPAPGRGADWPARLRHWLAGLRPAVPRPAMAAALAMLLAVVVVPWMFLPTNPDLRELYGEQALEALLIPPDRLPPRGRGLPDRRLWLGFAEPTMAAAADPDNMIRLGIAIGALQVLALSGAEVAPGDPHGAAALLRELEVPVALPGLDGWTDDATRRAFLASLADHALARELMAELHYGLWLEQLYLFLVRSLEEITAPGDLPAQARRILAGIDAAVLAPGESRLLETIAGLSPEELAGISPDRRIRETMARVEAILQRRSHP